MLLNLRKPKNLNLVMGDHVQADGEIKTIRYRIVEQSDTTSSTKFPKSPPQISLEKIDKMTDIDRLKELEKKYDEFLERNCQILLLHDIVDEYLEIRDALTLKLSRLDREERMRYFKENEATNINTNINTKYAPYDHEHQVLFPVEMRLTERQIQQGYIPYPNEPKEFKCGCLSIKYYAQCCCRILTSSVCLNTTCNEKLFPTIKLHSYCMIHSKLKSKQEIMEKKLEYIKKELSAIKRQSNSLDFEDYKNNIDKKPRRISKFPWKNVNKM